MNSVSQLAAAIVAAYLVVNPARSADLPLRFQVPNTTSPEARKELELTYRIRSHLPRPTRPTSLAQWDAQRAIYEKRFVPLGTSLADRLHVTVTDDQIAGVPVLRLRPMHLISSGRLLVYLHGGGYTVFSAHSSLSSPSLVAAATGDEVVSVDYTLAPRANWRGITDQVVAVWRALLARGVAPQNVGFFGDSAGGSLATGAVLKMRDLGLRLPGALYLMSPWSDITDTGDTYQTLADVDPILDPETSSWNAEAYADRKDQKNSYVSPVYGDFTKPFPPVLIQGGTREMFLSNEVRLYQAIRGGGHEATLDLYEGMPHVFQGVAPNSPETRTAIARAAAFFKDHLKAG